MNNSSEKFIGIVLSATAQKESDCRLTVLTPEGKAIYVASGVKKQNAKLKFATQPFALCEFLVAGHKIIGATSIESFFDITKDANKYWAGCVLLKAAEAVPLDSFLLLVNSLKTLCFEKKANPSSIVINFLLNLLQQSGYALNFKKCCVCDGSLLTNRFISNTFSGIVCGMHKGIDYIQIDAVVSNTLKLVSETALNRVHTIIILPEVSRQALCLLGRIFEGKFEKLTVLDDYIKLY